MEPSDTQAAPDWRAVVDELGEWLCRDMEKAAAKEKHTGDRAQLFATIRDVAARIHFYRDNCQPASVPYNGWLAEDGAPAAPPSGWATPDEARKLSDPAAVPHGWRPLESAPRSRPILLRGGDGSVYKARWDEDRDEWDCLHGQPVPFTPQPVGWAEVPGEALQGAPDWDRCQAVANAPDVDEALECFADDPFGDEARKLSGQQAPAPAAAPDGDRCDGCRRIYTAVHNVPGDVWALIAPRPETLGDHNYGGGMLCPDCAATAAKRLGIRLLFVAERWEEKPAADKDEQQAALFRQHSEETDHGTE